MKKRGGGVRNEEGGMLRKDVSPILVSSDQSERARVWRLPHRMYDTEPG